jgi:hypothetical protein
MILKKSSSIVRSFVRSFLLVVVTKQNNIVPTLALAVLVLVLVVERVRNGRTACTEEEDGPPA